MRSQTWDNGLTVTEGPEWVEVEQWDRRYRVRKLQLSAQVEQVIGTAIAHGFGAHWVPNRPQDAYLAGGERYEGGSPAMTFARSPAEHWAFVIDQQSIQDEDVICLTFAERLRGVLQEAGVDFRVEARGGQNCLVGIRSLQRALEAMQGRRMPELLRLPAATELST